MNISLVIPVRDEERSISRLLASIAGQTRSPDEVIFIDAGSADKTRYLIETRKDDKLAVKVISIGPAYPGKARNAGIKEAKHDLIAFTDGGIELDNDWLKELNSFMEKDASCDVVYGSYFPRTDTLFKECLAIAVVPPFTSRNGVCMRTRFIASSLMKRSVWEGVGAFPDLRAAEDRIFMERVEDKGFKVLYNPKAFVIWDIPENLKRVIRRFCSYSYHDMRAGRSRDWHIPVLKMYIAVFICILLGAFMSPIFFILPVIGFAARVIKKILININEPYFKLMNVPAYAVISGFLIFSIDCAMFAGWARYLTGRLGVKLWG
ncbi:MAG: glycosyltransferase [Candidatus Omnitrophica bacterium]|nr:glycosyltransferase [Candidatus Omnitrophota bacterium]